MYEYHSFYSPVFTKTQSETHVANFVFNLERWKEVVGGGHPIVSSLSISFDMRISFSFINNQ